MNSLRIILNSEFYKYYLLQKDCLMRQLNEFQSDRHLRAIFLFVNQLVHKSVFVFLSFDAFSENVFLLKIP